MYSESRVIISQASANDRTNKPNENIMNGVKSANHDPGNHI